MYPPPSLIILKLLLSTLLLVTPSQSLSQGNHEDDHESSSLFCESWRFSVETNNAGNWSTIPSRCYEFVNHYMTGDRYVSDLGVTGRNALDYAKTVDIAGDGMDAWVFDIDETLLSMLAYYKLHKFRSTTLKVEVKWGLRHKLTVLPASLSLYNEIRQLGFTVFLLTGRPEWLRNQTVTNLLYAGYNDWERLILRQSYDERKKGYRLQIWKQKAARRWRL